LQEKAEGGKKWRTCLGWEGFSHQAPGAGKVHNKGGRQGVLVFLGATHRKNGESRVRPQRLGCKEGGRREICKRFRAYAPGRFTCLEGVCKEHIRTELKTSRTGKKGTEKSLCSDSSAKKKKVKRERLMEITSFQESGEAEPGRDGFLVNPKNLRPTNPF